MHLSINIQTSITVPGVKKNVESAISAGNWMILYILSLSTEENASFFKFHAWSKDG